MRSNPLDAGDNPPEPYIFEEEEEVLALLERYHSPTEVNDQVVAIIKTLCKRVAELELALGKGVERSGYSFGWADGEHEGRGNQLQIQLGIVAELSQVKEALGKILAGWAGTSNGFAIVEADAITSAAELLNKIDGPSHGSL